MFGRKTAGIAVVCALFAVMGFVVTATGCQEPGKVVKVQESTVCPMCKTVTETSSIEGMTFKTHVCPQCKEEYQEVWDGFYVPGVTAHVCTHCQALVEECPQCRAQR